MKAQIAAKYIQFLNNKKANKNSGFTLIELLVVIIIIGILSAIALPSFLNQAAKARGAEAKANVGALNRAQQAYYLEQQTFTTDPSLLGLSLDLSTENFNYTSAGTALTASVNNLGTSTKPDIKSYIGGTYYLTGITKTVLCEAKTAGTGTLTAPAVPANAGAEATCDAGTTVVVK